MNNSLSLRIHNGVLVERDESTGQEFPVDLKPLLAQLDTGGFVLDTDPRLVALTALGDLAYGGAAGVATRLAGNTSATKQVLAQTGTGTVSAPPAWATLSYADVGAAPAAGSASITTLGAVATCTSLTSQGALAGTEVHVPTVKTNSVTPTDLLVKTGAAKTLILETGVYDDLQFALSSGKVGGSNVPTWEALTANTSAYSFTVNDYIDLGANEPPHSWVEGTAGDVHVHITIKSLQNAGAARYCKWEVYLAISDPGGIWTELGPFLGEQTIPNGAAALTSYLLDLGDVTLTGYHIGSQIKCRVKRIAATGGTEYSANVFATQVGIHMLRDAMGSRHETTKA